MWKRLMLAAVLVAGCAEVPNTLGTMIPGRMTAMTDGRVLPLQIEVTTGSGKITATDPKYAETLSGAYTAMLETKVMQHTQSTLFGDQVTGQTVETSGLATGSAVLVGDKGHVINLTMTIQPGNPPHGFGEGVDNKGGKYNLQF